MIEDAFYPDTGTRNFIDAANVKRVQVLALVIVEGLTAFTVNAGSGSSSPVNVYKGQLKYVAPNQQGTIKSEHTHISPPENHPGGWLWLNDDEDYHCGEVLKLTKEGRLPLSFFEHLSDASIANAVSTAIDLSRTLDQALPGR